MGSLGKARARVNATSPPAYAVDPGRRQILFGGAMLATASAAMLLVPKPGPPAVSAGGLDAAIPKQFGDWRFVSASGLVLPPRDETETRTYDEVLTRVYRLDDGGPDVMFLLAYGAGQTGLFEVHRPEACYPAQGFHLSDRRQVPVPTGGGREVEATFWSAESDVRPEQLLYWTRIGRFFPRSWAAEHVAVVRSNLVMYLPDGVLVRMSVQSNDPDASAMRLQRFALSMIDAVGPVGRRIMLGE